MGFFTRARPAAARVEPTLAPPVESRSTLDYGPGWGSLATMYGAGGMSARGAENLATMVACVNAVSAGLAALPARVYRTEGLGRVEAPGHPVARLLRVPNTRQSWVDWLEFTVAQLLLRGNSLSVVERDGAGRPVALTPIPWECCSVQILPSGRLAYDIVASTAPYGGPVMARRYLDSEVFHLKDRSDDGIVGRSRLSRAPAVLEAATGLQEYSTAIWGNAATPSGLITLAPGVKKEGKDRAEAYYNDRLAGTHNAKRIFVADRDTTFIPMSVSPEDAEVLASRQFTVVEICRLMNVPPPIVQAYEYNAFASAAQANLWYATNTLAPIARKVEAEFQRSVFTDPAFHLEVDLSGLVRGDYVSRWQANVAAVTANILTADEVRAQEGYGPRPATESVPPTA